MLKLKNSDSKSFVLFSVLCWWLNIQLSIESTLDAKRLIGRKFDDPVVHSDMKHWPFKVVNDSSKPKVEVEYKGEIKTFYAEEISSMVLTKMKEIAEAYLGKVVNKIE